MATEDLPAGISDISKASSTCGNNVCDVCLKEISDPRLLLCLHSFCETCIDRLAVGKSSAGKQYGKDGKCAIGCPTPIYGMSCRLMDVSAADFTRLVGKATAACALCQETEGNEEPAVLCSHCEEAFCNSHVLRHLLSSGELLPLSDSYREISDELTLPRRIHKKCAEHVTMPEEFFCMECDAAMCSHCALLGRHAGHQPVGLLADVLAQRQEAVTDKLTTLAAEIVPRSVQGLEEVDCVREKLIRQASATCDIIKVTRNQAVDVVTKCMQHKLQDVDDLEDTHYKVLDHRTDAVEDQVSAMKSAISFFDQLMKCNGGGPEMDELLSAVEERLEALSARKKENSELNQSIEFMASDDKELLARCKIMLGVVSECAACADYCCVKGDRSITTPPGQLVTFLLQGKDDMDAILDHGGDVVTAACLLVPDTPLTETRSRLGCEVIVDDGGGGTYTLACTPKHAGEYRVDVTVNNEKLPLLLSIQCVQLTTECQLCSSLDLNQYTCLPFGSGQLAVRVKERQSHPLSLLSTLDQKGCHRSFTQESNSSAEESSGRIDELRQVLKATEKVYGTNHLKVARTLSDLSNAVASVGDYCEAKVLLQRGLEIEEICCGKRHVQVAKTLSSLANAVAALGDHREAKALYQRALHIKEIHYGKQHIKVAKTLNGLASTIAVLGDHREAEVLYKRTLYIREMHYGKQSIKVARTLYNLAVTKAALGDHCKAEVLYKRALHIDEVYYGKQHVRLARTLNALALTVADLGDHHQAKALLERAVHIDELHYGKEHIEVARTLNKLAVAMGLLGEHREAKALLERSLCIKEMYYGQKHVDVARTLYNLALAIAHLGDYQEAKALFKRSLHIQEIHYGGQHIEVAITLSDLAFVTAALGDNQEAKVLYERVLHIQEEHYGYEHMLTARTLGDLARTLQQLGCIREARQLFRRKQRIEEPSKKEQVNHCKQQ